MRALRRVGRIALWIVAILLLIVVVTGGVVALGINTSTGHRLIERAAALGGAEITGLDGRFPDDFSVRRIAVADAAGVWLEIDNLRLDWSPTALIHKTIKASELTATRVHVARYPSGGGSSQSSSSSSGGFDYRVDVGHLKVDTIQLPEITLTLEGRAIYQPGEMDVKLAATTQDAMGQGPAALDATLAGPLGHVAVAARIDGKGLTTRADGTVDLDTLAADLRLGIDQPAFAGVSATRFDATVKGDASNATLQATLLGLKLPGSQPQVLGDGPLHLDATYRKGSVPDVTARLSAGASAASGMKIAADAEVTLATLAGKLNLTIDRLAVEGAGATQVTLQAQGDAKAADLHSVITGLTAPGVQPAMLGTTPLALDVRYRQGGAPELAVKLAGDTVLLDTAGALPTNALALDYHIVLPKLAAFAPAIAGRADLSGRIDGAFDNFAVKALADVGITTGGVASTIKGTIDASGLPAQPQGAALIKGAYGGQPVSLDVNARIGPDRQPVIVISDAAWQGIAAKGAFTLAADGGLPTGNLTIDAKRLPAPTTAGLAHATIDLARQGATPVLKVMAEVTGLAVEGTRLARSVLTGEVTDPIGKTPTLRANLVLSGVQSGAYRQDVRLDVTGPQNALAIRLGVTGTAALTAAATLDVPASRLNIASLQGTAQGQTLRLAAPTAITYAPQVTLGATRITLGGSALDIAGRVSPTLDLTASLRAVPAELAKLADPSIAAEGSLTAQARLQGTTSAPTGTLKLTGAGLRVRNPPGIPALRIDADATLGGESARIDARLAAGSARLALAGIVPIRPGGDYNLTARGQLELALLDSFLAASGAQTRGTLSLDATVTGSQPTPAGTLTLHDGSVTVPTQGARLSDIEAVIRAQPDRVVIQSLTAKAGSGTIGASGSLGLAAPMPIDLKLTARHASPISSDLLTMKLNADLGLSGAVQTGMAARGTIGIERADINIPQSLPSSLPVLQVRQKGPPPPPPAPAVPITLDLTMNAPDQIFVRGHGLDAELGGKLRIGGTAAAPQPDGGFTLRRGTFSLAGQTLNFTTGRVFFDGSVPIDPSLDFAATAYSSSLAATLSVTGYASKPKIALSSVPDRPQDEVLAQLLFHRSASELGPLQLAQIAAALAQIADVGGSGSLDPLGSVRKGLGLDVLSVNSNPGSATSVEAGRNIAHGVYLGAKQSTSGSGSQATVRVDLAPGLRAEADLGVAPAQETTPAPGAPPTGNQVGITYEFEY